MIRILAALLLAAPVLAPALATTARAAQFDMSIAGLPVGTVTIDYRDGYVIEGRARSGGAARALSPYDYAAVTTGRGSGARLAPDRYEEVERRRGGEERAILRLGADPAVEMGSGDALPAASLRGALDPLTAMHLILRARPLAEACAVDVRFTDGKRLSRVALAPTADPLRCAGLWFRLDGPPPADGRERRDRVPFAVDLAPAPAGGVWAARVTADAPIGNFVLRRR